MDTLGAAQAAQAALINAKSSSDWPAEADPIRPVASMFQFYTATGR